MTLAELFHTLEVEDGDMVWDAELRTSDDRPITGVHVDPNKQVVYLSDADAPVDGKPVSVTGEKFLSLTPDEMAAFAKRLCGEALGDLAQFEPEPKDGKS